MKRLAQAVAAASLVVATVGGCTAGPFLPADPSPAVRPPGSPTPDRAWGWGAFWSADACDAPTDGMQVVPRPVTTWTAVDGCRALATGPGVLAGVTASGHVLWLDPLQDLAEVTAVAASGDQVLVAGIDESGAPILVAVSAAGVLPVDLPEAAAHVVAAAADGDTTWFAVETATGGVLARLVDDAVQEVAVIEESPTALAVGHGMIAIATASSERATLLSGAPDALTRQPLGAGDIVTGLTATDDGFAAAAQHQTDGVPGETTFWISDTTGSWHDVPYGPAQVHGLAASGTTVFVSMSRGDEPARVWSSQDRLETLAPVDAVPVGETVPMLSAAGSGLWVLGDDVAVHHPEPDATQRPGLNEFEQQLAAIMAAAGVQDPGAAEHNYGSSAQMGGNWHGHVALVGAHETGFTLPGEVTVDFDLGRIRGELVDFDSWGSGVRFVCGTRSFEVALFTPELTPTNDTGQAAALAVALIDHMEC